MKQMSNNYAPCFNRIDFVVIPSHIELNNNNSTVKWKSWTHQGWFMFFKFYESLWLHALSTKKNWGGPLNWINGRKSEAVVRRCFENKVFLKIFAKFTGKHLRPVTLLKQRLWHSRFPVNFAKFFTAPFLYNTSGGCKIW